MKRHIVTYYGTACVITDGTHVNVIPRNDCPEHQEAPDAR